MKGQTKAGWKAIVLLLASAAFGSAQVNSLSAPAAPLQGQNNGTYNTQPRPSSVGPGTVNYVEGQVMLTRSPGGASSTQAENRQAAASALPADHSGDSQNLTSRSVGQAVLQPDQLLETNNGYVEILLTPGAFLRLGNNSQVRLVSAGLADTQVQLVQGSGILEVDQLIKGTHLAVQMNNVATQIQEKGLYNFDTTQSAIRVLDGKLKVTEGARTQTLGKHDQVLLAGDQPLKKRSFDESTVKAEPLYVWSKARSEDESQASLRAARNAELYSAAGPGWYWDPYANYYGFWPLTGALYNPFGWGFYSPAYFGFYPGVYGGYYGGYYLPSGRWYVRGNGWHGRVNGINSRVAAAPTGGFHSSAVGGFRGGSSGFHGAGGHR